MAETSVNLLMHVDFPGDAFGSILKMVASGFDGEDLPPLPEKLMVTSACQKQANGTILVYGAPSPELFRWLADVIESNPRFS